MCTVILQYQRLIIASTPVIGSFQRSHRLEYLDRSGSYMVVVFDICRHSHQPNIANSTNWQQTKEEYRRR
jgi:hypothetical protein